MVFEKTSKFLKKLKFTYLLMNNFSLFILTPKCYDFKVTLGDSHSKLELVFRHKCNLICPVIIEVHHKHIDCMLAFSRSNERNKGEGTKGDCLNGADFCINGNCLASWE